MGADAGRKRISRFCSGEVAATIDELDSLRRMLEPVTSISCAVVCTFGLISRSRAGISHTIETPTTTTQAIAMPPSQALFNGQLRGQRDPLRSGRAGGRWAGAVSRSGAAAAPLDSASGANTAAVSARAELAAPT